MSEKKHVYIFETDLSKYIEGIYGLVDHNEEIQTKVVSIDEAKSMIKQEIIMDLNCIYAIEKT
jgi:hypothetical protein